MKDNSIKTSSPIFLLFGLLVFTLAMISSSAAADTIYVNNATGNDDNDGLTNTTAKATIQNGTNTVDPDGTVYVADGIYQEHVTIDKNLNLIGQSQTGTIIDGTHNGRPLTINSAVTVSITNFTITNGTTTGLLPIGGGIYNNGGNLTMTDCNIINNTATDTRGEAFADGGGIFNDQGTLTMTNCNIINNIATATNIVQLGNSAADGGGIFNYEGTLTMTNCNIINNTATATNVEIGDSSAAGGGIYYYAGVLTMTDCNIINNTATATATASIFTFAYGGGIYYYAGVLTMTDCNIINNTATATTTSGYALAHGGGIYNNAGSLNVNFSRIVGNNPHAIYNASGTVINLEDNWWGSNVPDFPSLISGATAPNNWLYMTINAIPTSINNTQTSLILVSFNNRYNGTTVTPYIPGVGEYIPDGSPVTFTTDLGSIGCKTIDKYTYMGLATATLTADETLGIAHVTGLTDSETVNVVVTINPKSNVYLNITPDKANPVVGDTVTYRFKVGNYGPDSAENVVMTFTVPEGLVFAGATDNIGNKWTYDANTKTITWNLGTVPVGDPDLWVSLLYSAAGEYRINPLLSTTTYDPDLNANTQSVTVRAAAAPVSANAATTTAAASENTVGMQSTGIPITGLILAILMVLGGFSGSRKQ